MITLGVHDVTKILAEKYDHQGWRNIEITFEVSSDGTVSETLTLTLFGSEDGTKITAIEPTII